MEDAINVDRDVSKNEEILEDDALCDDDMNLDKYTKSITDDACEESCDKEISEAKHSIPCSRVLLLFCF